MTPVQISEAARRLLNAVGSDFWADTEIISDHLYFASLELANETYCIENRYTATSVASQAEYVRPTRAIAIKRITYNGEKLKPFTEREQDSLDLNTASAITGTPQYYWEFDDVLNLFPTPDTAGLTIKISSYDEPSIPTSTSTLEIPTRYHGKLVFGVAYYMSLKEVGHPSTGRLESQWAFARQDVLRWERQRKNRDMPARVKLEEDFPSTVLGAI